MVFVLARLVKEVDDRRVCVLVHIIKSHHAFVSAFEVQRDVAVFVDSHAADDGALHALDGDPAGGCRVDCELGGG